MSLVILIACRGLLQVCGMLNTSEGMLREGKRIRVPVSEYMWTNEEKGNVEADHVCGRARKMALGDELKWLDRVNEWRAIGVRSWRRNM